MKLKAVVVIFYGAVLTSNVQAQELDQLAAQKQKLAAFIEEKKGSIYQVSFETHRQVIDLLTQQLNSNVHLISESVARFNANPVLDEKFLQTTLSELETAKQFINSIYLQKKAHDEHHATYRSIYQRFLNEEASTLSAEFVVGLKELIQHFEDDNNEYNKRFEKQTAHFETLKNHIAQDYMNLGEIARNLTSSRSKDVASHTSH